MSERPWRYTDPQGTEQQRSTSELRAELAAGKLAPSTLVVREGMSEPQPAFTQPELATAAIAAARQRPPSIPPTAAMRGRAPMKTLVGIEAPLGGDLLPPEITMPIVAPADPSLPTATETRPPSFVSDVEAAHIPLAPKLPDTSSAPRIESPITDETTNKTEPSAEAPQRPRSVPPPLPARAKVPPRLPTPIHTPRTDARKETLTGLNPNAKAGDSKPPPVRSKPPPPPIRRSIGPGPAPGAGTGATTPAAKPPVPLRAMAKPAPPKPLALSTMRSADATPSPSPAAARQSDATRTLETKIADPHGIHPSTAETKPGNVEPKTGTTPKPSEAVATEAKNGTPQPSATKTTEESVTAAILSPTKDESVDVELPADPPTDADDKPSPGETTLVMKQDETGTPRPVEPKVDPKIGDRKNGASKFAAPENTERLPLAAITGETPAVSPGEIGSDTGPLPTDAAAAAHKLLQPLTEADREEAARAKPTAPKRATSDAPKRAKSDPPGDTREDPPVEVEARESRSSRPARSPDAVEIPKKSLAGASVLWMVGLVCFFFVGRCSGANDENRRLYAREGVQEGFFFHPSGTPREGEPKPCWVTRQPSRWAPKAGKSVPIEIRPAGANLAVGFAIDDRHAAGISVDPKSGKFEQTMKRSAEGDITRVTPMASAPEGFLVAEKGQKKLVPVQAEPPFFLAIDDASIAFAEQVDAEPKALFSLPEKGEVSAEHVVATGGLGYFVAVRQGNTILGGGFDANKQPLGGLKPIQGSGGRVGKPRVAYSASDVAVVFADRAADDAPWTMRIGTAPAGTVPETTVALAAPEGGPGGDIIAPDVIGFPDGRWLVMWTEGSSGERAIRAQTYDRSLAPVGDPIALSPPAGDFGQAVLATVGNYTLVVFLQRGEAAFELWGAVLSCG